MAFLLGTLAIGITAAVVFASDLREWVVDPAVLLPPPLPPPPAWPWLPPWAPDVPTSPPNRY